MNSLQKHLIYVFLIMSAASTLAGCVPDKKDKKVSPRYQSQELLETINQKLKDGTLKDSIPPEVSNAISEIVKSGSIKGFLPPTSVMVLGVFIPIVTIVGFFGFLIIFIKLYHMRTMALIEKGQYKRKPLNIKWELFYLFVGLILTLVSVGISIYMISLYGLQSWTITAGIIPLFVGIAFLIFYKIYCIMKKNDAVH